MRWYNAASGKLFFSDYRAFIFLVESCRLVGAGGYSKNGADFCFRVLLLQVDDLVQHSFWKDGGGVMEPATEPGTVGDPALIPSAAADGFPCQVSGVSACRDRLVAFFVFVNCCCCHVDWSPYFL